MVYKNVCGNLLHHKYFYKIRCDLEDVYKDQAIL